MQSKVSVAVTLSACAEMPNSHTRTMSSIHTGTSRAMYCYIFSVVDLDSLLGHYS
jgi:hypothetical protein